MPTYRIEGPDGKRYRFDGPSGLTGSDLDLLRDTLFQTEPELPVAPPPPKAETGFIPSVMRGGRGVYSLVGDVLPAMVGKAVGADEYAKKQMEEAAAYQKETEEKYPSAIPSFTDIKGVGDAVTYIVESVGEAIPSILPGLFTGGAASLAGRGAIAAAKEAAQKTAMSTVAKGVTEAEAKNLAMKAGIEAAKREALKYEAAGALTGSAVQNIPDVYQNLYEKGKDDLGTALAFGAFNSVLDAVTPINLLRKAKLSGIPEEQIIGAWYKRAGKGLIEGFATEGGTEMLQEMSSAAAERFVDENNAFFTPQNFERFINAGLKGGLGGGVITGGMNIATGRAPEPGTPEAGGEQAARVDAEKAKLEQELGLTPPPEQGAANVAEPITPAAGTSTDVSASGRSVAPPAREPKTSKRDGVVSAGQNVGNAPTGKTGQPAPVELPDKVKEAIRLSIADGMDKRDTIDSLFDFEIYSQEGFPDVPPLIDKSQQKAAEDYYDSLSKPKQTDLAPDEKTENEYRAEQMSAMQTEEEPSTASPTEVLDEDKIKAAYAQGVKAAQEGRGMSTEEYQEGRPGFEDFARGWLDTKYPSTKEEKPSGTQTPKAQQAEEKGQEAPAATAVEPTADEDAATQKRLLAAIEKANKQLRKDENLATGDPKLEASKKRYDDAQKAYKDFVTESEPRRTKRYEAVVKGVHSFNDDQRTMYDEESEFHNEENPERKVPEYGNLTVDQREKYLESIKKNTMEEHGKAIEALANDIHGKAEEKKTERKVTPIKEHENKQLQKGNNVAFLNRIRMDSRNPIRRAVAQRIFEAKLKTKVELVDSLPENRKAEYDPKSDVIRITKEHQDEQTLMHEYTHAATIKVIDLYENGKLDELTEDQQAGVVHLEYLMDESRKELADKFPDAYENLHEFVSNAINNSLFQNELGKLSIPLKDSIVPEERSLWGNILQALAKLMNLSLVRASMEVEAFAAFDKIVSAPPKGGINKAPLPARKQAVVKQAPEVKEEPKAQSDQEIADEAVAQVKLKERGGKVLLKNLFTTHGAHWLAEHFQNDRYILKAREDRAALLGQLERLGEGLNNVYGQLTRSTGIAVDLFNTHMKFKTEDVHKAVIAYANKMGIDVDRALAQLHIILEARHEPERRLVKYIKDVPLDRENTSAIKLDDFKNLPPELKKMFSLKEYSAFGFRDEVINKILTQPMFEVNDATRKSYAEALRKAIDKVVFDKANHAKVVEVREGTKLKTVPTTPAMFDINDERYNVIGQRTPAQIAAITRQLDTKEAKAQIDAVEEKLQAVHEETKELNKMANYWSRPVANVVDFYGFEHYVPFKGRPGEKGNDPFDFNSKRLGGEFQDGQDTMQGRMSEADNPILQSLADGATAALRAGKKDVTLAIKNAIDPKNRILQGRIVARIKFEERYKGEVEKKDISGEDKVYHYNDDGSIDVIQITNKKESEAIRRTFRTNQPIIDLINRFTSGIGQLHTRYNTAFAPMNFVRDALTNAFILGAELGPVKAGQLLTNISAEVSSGGLYRSLNYSNLYAQGKFAEINKLAGGDKPYKELNDKERYYRDLQDFVKKGGRVSYLQGVASKGALDELIKEVGRSGVMLKKEQIDKFIDIYNDMFELSSRVATYRLMKEEIFRRNMDNGLPEERALKDAEIQAVEYAKNLANFEQVGRWGKAMGAMYMFFRPAATGAVRAIEATAPAFQKFDEKLFREEAKAQGISEEKIDKAVKTIRERQRSARVMAASLVGVGVGMYLMAMMLSGDDDQGRNKVATDDMARWSRYARFHIPGTDIILQIPWGFGLGTFASAGAQIASVFAGRNSIADAASNILTTGLDSYLPLPVSKINMIDNFPAWAIDSAAPSAVRPFFEYVMNLDGLGRQIYNNRQSRYGDAYTGGDSIPEIYKGAARELFNMTNGKVDWSPNTMYFFASNYVDGMAKAFTGVSNLGLTILGKKEGDLKNDTLFINSFIGSKSNVDAREFSKAEERIKGMEKRINALKDKPEMLDKYLSENASDYYLVQYYNSAVNGQIRTLRAAANQIRSDATITIKERKERLDEIVKVQNMVKRNVLDAFESLTGSPSIYR